MVEVANFIFIRIYKLKKLMTWNSIFYITYICQWERELYSIFLFILVPMLQSINTEINVSDKQITRFLSKNTRNFY